MTLLRLEGRGCVHSGSIDVGHHTRFEIIDRRHDLQLPGPGEIGEERAPQPQALGRPPSALLGRIVYEVPRLALNGDGRWEDWRSSGQPFRQKILLEARGNRHEKRIPRVARLASPPRNTA